MELRFFFDAGAGTCLWAGDDEARRHHDYAVMLEALPLSADTMALGHDLLRRHDARLDWNDPGAPILETARDAAAFHAEARHFLARLRIELGDGYVVIDELER